MKITESVADVTVGQLAAFLAELAEGSNRWRYGLGAEPPDGAAGGSG